MFHAIGPVDVLPALKDGASRRFLVRDPVCLLCHVVEWTGLPLALTFWAARLPGERTLACEITLALSQTPPAAPHPDILPSTAPSSPATSATLARPPPQARLATRRSAPP